MAATRDPQPDHPLVSGLDKVFTGKDGHAPALAGWLEHLAHPEMHGGPRRVGLVSGEVIESQVPGVNTPQSGPVYSDEGSIMRDLGVKEFFAHADVLSGQQVSELNDAGELTGAGIVKDAYDRIEEVRFRKQSESPRTVDSEAVYQGLVSASADSLFTPEVWGGDAAKGAKCRYDQMALWYTTYRKTDLGEMMAFLPRFAAIIHKARVDINELMGKLVDALNKWLEEGEVDATFFPSLLQKVIGAIGPPSPASMAQTFLTLVNDGLNAAGKSKPEDGGSEFSYNGSKSDGVYQMLKSFITAGNEVCDQAAAAVTELVGAVEMRHGNESGHPKKMNWVSVPDWNVPCAPH